MRFKFDKPLAITMWDFSWLERRWTGAGYEDWDQVLDDLKDRGYDAVRIDAYPHLIAKDPDRTWTLKPEWDQQVWGAPAITRVDHIAKNLIEFMSVCKRKNIYVALSTWYREDVDNTRMNIMSPLVLASIWKTTLDIIKEAGLIDTLLYVDFCNEYPLSCWAPFLSKATGQAEILRASAEGERWMKESIEHVRQYYPDLNYTFSMTSEYDTLDKQNVSFLDLLEPHVWMAQFSEFYEKVGYGYERFGSKGYENLALYGEDTYRSNPEYWQKKLLAGIDLVTGWSERTKKALATTECWGIVDYKDWPLLDWGYVKDLCALGVKHASSSGRWVAMATSNFCGPQFAGMWRDIDWHREQTGIIHGGKLPVDAIKR